MPVNATFEIVTQFAVPGFSVTCTSAERGVTSSALKSCAKTAVLSSVLAIVRARRSIVHRSWP